MSIEVANPNYTNTVGTPIEDFNATPAHQECLDTCDIHSQQQIMSMFGINATETDLVKDAIIHGEYAPLGCEGTSILHTGNLLERHGIYVHRCINATIDDLISELSQGHKIIVAVDADEIWAEDEKSLSAEYIKDVISPESNHAVVVVGVDTVTGDVDVVDPGDGNLKRINSNVFVNAWQDSHFFMMATNQSPQEYMINVSNNNNEEVTAMNDPKNNNNFGLTQHCVIKKLAVMILTFCRRIKMEILKLLALTLMATVNLILLVLILMMTVGLMLLP